MKIITLYFLLFIFGSASEDTIENLVATADYTFTHTNTPHGIWAFKILGSRPEYARGTFFISEDNSPKVIIQFKNGALEGQDVQIYENCVQFNMNLDGKTRYSVVLLFKGDQLFGDSYSNKTGHSIIGTRKHPIE